ITLDFLIFFFSFSIIFIPPVSVISGSWIDNAVTDINQKITKHNSDRNDENSTFHNHKVLIFNRGNHEVSQTWNNENTFYQYRTSNHTSKIPSHYRNYGNQRIPQLMLKRDRFLGNS